MSYTCTVQPLCVISGLTQRKHGNPEQFPSSGFKWTELIPPPTLWRVEHWRALCPNRMDEAHKSWPGNRQRRGGWRGRKCAAKSDSSTYTVQIKVSAACQLDYQMAPAALGWTTCYIFSDVSALPENRRAFWRWGATRIIVHSLSWFSNIYLLFTGEKCNFQWAPKLIRRAFCFLLYCSCEMILTFGLHVE